MDCTVPISKILKAIDAHRPCLSRGFYSGDWRAFTVPIARVILRIEFGGGRTLQPRPTWAQPEVVGRQGRVLDVEATPGVVDRLVREAIVDVRVELKGISRLAPLWNKLTSPAQGRSDGTAHVLLVFTVGVGAAVDHIRRRPWRCLSQGRDAKYYR